MTLRILLVSVEAPPSLDAEAFQVGKILSALQAESCLQIDVATASPFPVTTGLARIGQVITVPCRLRRWQRLLVRISLPQLAQRPDWCFLFFWRWRRVVSELNNPPQLIYSRSFPPSSTLAAYYLARHFGVPWFLHLSDPWCQTKWAVDRHFNSRWHKTRERMCLSLATRISFTSPSTLSKYKAAYPNLAERMCIDPNTYQDEDVNANSWVKGDKFRIIHTGSLDSSRNLDPILKALSCLSESHPIFNDIQFIQAGSIDDTTQRELPKSISWINIVGQLAYPAAISLQHSADLLLAIDWKYDSAIDAEYLLSKLIDYMAARRPILLITCIESASWNFVQSNRLGVSVEYNDMSSLASAILCYWESWRKKDQSVFQLSAPRADFSSSHVARSIAKAAHQAVFHSPLAPGK